MSLFHLLGGWRPGFRASDWVGPIEAVFTWPSYLAVGSCSTRVPLLSVGSQGQRLQTAHHKHQKPPTVYALYRVKRWS